MPVPADFSIIERLLAVKGAWEPFGDESSFMLHTSGGQRKLQLQNMSMACSNHEHPVLEVCMFSLAVMVLVCLGDFVEYVLDVVFHCSQTGAWHSGVSISILLPCQAVYAGPCFFSTPWTCLRSDGGHVSISCGFWFRNRLRTMTPYHWPLLKKARFVAECELWCCGNREFKFLLSNSILSNLTSKDSSVTAFGPPCVRSGAARGE